MQRKKRLIGILLVGALALTLSISAFAVMDESKESEKLYRMGDGEVEDSVRVVVQKDGRSTKAAVNPDTKYAFESDLSAEGEIGRASCRERV